LSPALLPTLHVVPAYSDNHVVTRAHLALFAKDGKLRCHFSDGASKLLAPHVVGVRTDFYVVKDEGGRDPSFEQAMSGSEGSAMDVLRDIAGRWPLSGDDAAALAEYLGLAVVRSPAFRAWYDRANEEALADPETRASSGLPDDVFDQMAQELRSQRSRIEMMARLISRMATLLGSMHWTLIRFSSPRLAISDNPLVAVPLSVGYTGPAVGMPGGVEDLIEVRLPVDPRHLLLLSWIDAPDDTPIVTGRHEWIRGINAATVMQAEQHWMHRPGPTPPHVADASPSLALAIYADAAAQGARDGRRRKAAWTAVAAVRADEDDWSTMRLVQAAFE